ncbi:hypothetical protein BMF94_3794 [Rhodotorula taiwanensis]|uniref:Uncharacterized protein n=1 Tax=Rhodotorula taiwanensis TaxID=741276 RepID=A0A2S5B8R1_9BASI|nr:hypothetical protein BMF94_3794 [Rhodotorula taiwanensis]
MAAARRGDEKFPAPPAAFHNYLHLFAMSLAHGVPSRFFPASRQA